MLGKCKGESLTFDFCCLAVPCGRHSQGRRSGLPKSVRKSETVRRARKICTRAASRCMDTPAAAQGFASSNNTTPSIYYTNHDNNHNDNDNNSSSKTLVIILLIFRWAVPVSMHGDGWPASKNLYMYVCMCVYMYVCIYIYIYRERYVIYLSLSLYIYIYI